MRILVVVNVYRPDLGGGVLFADFLEGLVKRGFEVEVRCAYPYYPEWRDKSGRNGWSIAQETEHGVKVRRFGLFIPSNPERLSQRLVHEASFFLSLSRVLPGPGEFDLVMAYCPLVGGLAFGALAARSTGAPLWLNVQDLAAEAAHSAGIVRNRGAGSILVAVQRWLFNRAQVWSTISPIMRDRLLPLAKSNQDVHELPNWLHGSLGQEIRRVAAAHGGAPYDGGGTEAGAVAHAGDRSELPPDGPIKLLYSGNIGGKQDLLTFCRMLGRSSGHFEFDIRGAGSGAEAIENWIRESGDPRFSLSPLTDEARLANGLASCDLFVITEKPDAGDSFIPSKLLPAFGAGAAILAVCDAESPLGAEMSAAQCGAHLAWNDATKLEALLEDPAGLRHVLPKWRSAARKRGLRYDRDQIIDRYADLIRKTVSRSQSHE